MVRHEGRREMITAAVGGIGFVARGCRVIATSLPLPRLPLIIIRGAARKGFIVVAYLSLVSSPAATINHVFLSPLPPCRLSGIWKRKSFLTAGTTWLAREKWLSELVGSRLGA